MTPFGIQVCQGSKSWMTPLASKFARNQNLECPVWHPSLPGIKILYVLFGIQVCQESKSWMSPLASKFARNQNLACPLWHPSSAIQKLICLSEHVMVLHKKGFHEYKCARICGYKSTLLQKPSFSSHGILPS